MATIEILSGDFRNDTTRIRYSEAGRAFVRLTSTDGRGEDLFLETEVVGAAEAGDGKVGDYLRRMSERDGFEVSASTSERRRLFVVLLRDGRKFVVSGDLDALAAFKAAAMPLDVRREMRARLDAGRRPAAPTRPAGGGSRLVPDLLARLLPARFLADRH